MKTIVFGVVFAVSLVLSQAHKEECPSREEVRKMDLISLATAQSCYWDTDCQKEERCCKTPKGKKCLSTKDADKEYSLKEKNDDNDDECNDDDNDTKRDGKNHHSKCHKHGFRGALIVTAAVLGVVLSIVVSITLVKKFCVRSKIGNSQIDIRGKDPSGRSSNYIVKPKSTCVYDSTEIARKEECWRVDTPPPPYFISPTAPPAYSVDPPPSYSHQAKMSGHMDKY
ncbi:uncharacterized protein LOC134232905 [Saccostrea cucullata]|uniref:uncharacterized protein LOC134232905 n=1 Tax=Saccostrea cuccullata TaxID=36930 RepID=UPI002ED4867D